MADSVSGVDSTGTAAAATSTTSTTKVGNSDLGKDDFLKLLVAQLTYQDPTNPTDNTEFVSQLATYSSLEQQMTMNDNLQSLITAQNMTTAGQATSMIGKVISYYDSKGNFAMGQVAFVDITNGQTSLVLTDNTVVDLSAVMQIADPDKLPSSGTGTGGTDTGDTGGTDETGGTDTGDGSTGTDTGDDSESSGA
jgi:flagellar basal-body rod modification protein FlgD